MCIEQVIDGIPIVAHQISCITDPQKIKRLGTSITIHMRRKLSEVGMGVGGGGCEGWRTED